MKGMTGYGRATLSFQDTTLECILSCYNKKTLDLSLKVPSFFSEYEPQIRKEVVSTFSRGAISLSIRSFEDPTAVKSSLKKRYDHLKEVADSFHLKVNDSELFHLLFQDSDLYQPRILTSKEPLFKALLSLLKEAIGMAEESRVIEGAALKTDFLKRKNTLENVIKDIKARTGDVVSQQVQRLQSLLSSYIPGQASIDDRLLKEVVLFADKVDCTEEVVRIEHHLQHMAETLQEVGPVGKKLDFLFQELLREFSTLGAKTSNADVSYLVIQAKMELDKLREQVQNVE